MNAKARASDPVHARFVHAPCRLRRAVLRLVRSLPSLSATAAKSVLFRRCRASDRPAEPGGRTQVLVLWASSLTDQCAASAPVCAGRLTDFASAAAVKPALPAAAAAAAACRRRQLGQHGQRRPRQRRGQRRPRPGCRCVGIEEGPSGLGWPHSSLLDTLSACPGAPFIRSCAVRTDT